MHWAEPKFDQLCDTMKLIVEEYDNAAMKGAYASDFVREYYSWEKCLPPRIDCMEKLLDDNYSFGILTKNAGLNLSPCLNSARHMHMKSLSLMDFQMIIRAR
jgi:hypothetical protein